MKSLFIVYALMASTSFNYSIQAASQPVQFDDVVTSQAIINAESAETEDFANGGYTDASCVDGHGVVHKAHCASPYIAKCVSSTPGQCACSCYYP